MLLWSKERQPNWTKLGCTHIYTHAHPYILTCTFLLPTERRQQQLQLDNSDHDDKSQVINNQAHHLFQTSEHTSNPRHRGSELSTDIPLCQLVRPEGVRLARHSFSLLHLFHPMSSLETKRGCRLKISLKTTYNPVDIFTRDMMDMVSAKTCLLPPSFVYCAVEQSVYKNECPVSGST